MESDRNVNYELMSSYLRYVCEHFEIHGLKRETYLKVKCKQLIDARYYNEGTVGVNKQHCLLIVDKELEIIELHCTSGYYNELKFLLTTFEEIVKRITDGLTVEGETIKVVADVTCVLNEKSDVKCCQCIDFTEVSDRLIIVGEISINSARFKRNVDISIFPSSGDVLEVFIFDHDVIVRPWKHDILLNMSFVSRFSQIINCLCVNQVHYFPKNENQLENIYRFRNFVKGVTTSCEVRSDDTMSRPSIIVHVDYLIRAGYIGNLSFIGTDLRHVEVLDLKYAKIDTLSEKISYMSDLRKIDISSTDVKILPTSMEQLRKLHTLNIRDTHVSVLFGMLPKSMQKLEIGATVNPDDVVRLQSSDSPFKPIKKTKGNQHFLTEYIVRLQSSDSPFKPIKKTKGNQHFLTEYILTYTHCNITDLNISNCGLMEFPMIISSLLQLERLNISNNHITVVPSCVILSLHRLHEFDFSCNFAKLDFEYIYFKLSSTLKNLKAEHSMLIYEGDLTSPSFESERILFRSMKHLEELNLKSCHLKTFPGFISLYSNLTVLNLDFNSIETIPDDSFAQTDDLRVFTVDNNELVSLPSSIRNLRNLCVLSVARNKLSVLPTGIDSLSMLSVLIIQGNKLEALPESLFSLKQLKILDASLNEMKSFPKLPSICDNLNVLNLECNQLTDFPDLRDAPNIEYINFNNNRLKYVPEYIFKRQMLRELDLTSNEIVDLPFLQVSDDLVLKLSKNKLKVPPNEIVEMGLKSIKAYMKDLLEKKCDVTPQVKVIFIGHSCAGKTTLCGYLSRRNNVKPPNPADRTRVMETSSFMLSDDDSSYSVAAFDMAGHDIYDSTHRLFFTSNAVYLLAVNMVEYKYEHFYPLIGKWYDMLTCYSPKSNLLLIGTHEDKLKSEDVPQKLQSIVRDVQMYAEKCSENEGLCLPTIVGKLTINCKNKKHESYKKLENLLLEVCHSGENISIVSTIPYSWNELEVYLKSFSPELYYVSLNQLSHFAKAAKITDFGTVLEYFTLTGKILYFKSGKLANYIFHKPMVISNALRSVFMHDSCELLQSTSPSVTVRKWFFNNKSILLHHQIIKEVQSSGVTPMYFEAIKSAMSNGIFVEKYIDTLFRVRLGPDVDVNILIDLLLKFDYCFEMTESSTKDYHFHNILKDCRKFCFPCYMKTSVSSEMLEKSFTSRKPEESQDFEIAFDLAVNCLDVVTIIVVALIQNHVSSVKLVWKYGLVAMFERVKVHLFCPELEAAGLRITARARFIKGCKDEAYRILWKIHTCILNVLSSLPGLRYNVGIVCPNCVNTDASQCHIFPLHKEISGEFSNETVCPACEHSVATSDLLMLFANPTVVSTKYTVNDVVRILRKDPHIQVHWKLLAVDLKMDHKIPDISATSNLPSECISELIKLWVYENGQENFVHTLIANLRDSSYIYSAENLEEKLEISKA